MLEGLLQPAEVGPPQEARHDHRQDRDAGERGGALLGSHRRASHDERLADGDDDEQPVPLGQVSGMEVPVLRPPGDLGRHDVRHDRQRPERDPKRRVGNGAGEDQDQPDARQAGPCPRAPGIGVRALHVEAQLQHQPEDPNHDIGDGEPDRVVLERVGDRRGHDERDRRRRQRDESNAGVGRVRRVEGPGELGPGPPDQPEEQQRAQDPARVEVMRGQDGDLGDGEHEHQVEEELDEGDRLRLRRAEPSLRLRHIGLHGLASGRSLALG